MTTIPWPPSPRGALLLAGLVGLFALPLTAQARVFVGVGVGVPVAPPYYAYPPPVYAPPPVYYPPPPAYSYAPPPPPVAESSQPYYGGGTCYAGVYVCQAPGSLPVGSQCSCPGIGAPSYGTVR